MRNAALLLFCVLVTACASHSRPPDAIDLVIDVNANANPDINARPSPVAITLLQLKHDRAFNTADYLTLSRNLDATLGTSLLAKQALSPIAAGGKKSIVVKLRNDTRFIGVIAQISQFSARKTRISIPAGALDDHRQLRLIVDEAGVRIAPHPASTPIRITRFNED